MYFVAVVSAFTYLKLYSYLWPFLRFVFSVSSSISKQRKTVVKGLLSTAKVPEFKFHLHYLVGKVTFLCLYFITLWIRGNSTYFTGSLWGLQDTHRMLCPLETSAQKKSCYYYLLFFQFSYELFTFFIYPRYLVISDWKLIFNGRFFLMSWPGEAFLDGQSHSGLSPLDQTLWKHTGSRPRGHMNGTSQSLAVADGTFLAPSFTQAGQHASSGSIPSLLLWFPSAPLWGKPLSNQEIFLSCFWTWLCW